MGRLELVYTRLHLLRSLPTTDYNIAAEALITPVEGDGSQQPTLSPPRLRYVRRALLLLGDSQA